MISYCLHTKSILSLGLTQKKRVSRRKEYLLYPGINTPPEFSTLPYPPINL